MLIDHTIANDSNLAIEIFSELNDLTVIVKAYVLLNMLINYEN